MYRYRIQNKNQEVGEVNTRPCDKGSALFFIIKDLGIHAIYIAPSFTKRVLLN